MRALEQVDRDIEIVKYDILFYQTQCPECGSRVESHDEPVLREEIFGD